MQALTKGAVEEIANGFEVDRPILQILGHKKVNSSSGGERFRLLVSDGVKINSFTMLSMQLNSMITDNLLTEFSICEITRYATSMVNKGGKEQRVMIILNLKVLTPGSEVGERIGNPTNVDTSSDGDSDRASMAQSSAPVRKPVESAAPKRTQIETSGDIATTPISALSPYQNRWVIKVRVVNKSPIRSWSNSRGEGKLFSMDLVDESGEIRCTGFRTQVEKFYDMIEQGKVYYISRCQLKTANKQFNNLKCDYEITLTNESEIIPCHDESQDIPTLQFDFQPISNIEHREKNDILDVLGVVKNVSDLNVITARTTGRELKKRDIFLVDDSNAMVCLTLWGQQAEEFNGSDHPVLAVKGARVGEFNGGKNLSTLSSSVLQIDPDIEEAHRLRGWYGSGGAHEDIKSVSRSLGGAGGGQTGPWITFQEAIDQGLGFNGTTDVYTIKAFVNLVRVENSLYKSCPTENCKKKLIDQDNEMYRCEKCDREFPNYKYRLIANMNLADWSANQWATAFTEEAEKILGATSQELGELLESDSEAFHEKFGEAAFKEFIFKMRAKVEVFNDEKKLRATIIGVSPVDYKLYNAHLLTKIKEAMGVGQA